MSTPELSRRRFLVQSTSAAAALGASTLVSRAGAGASERINIGIIGCGGRGTYHIDELAKLQSAHNVRVVAVCDVWKVNLINAVVSVTEQFGAAPRSFTRFGDLLALDDVDAVVIATPDFGHTPIMIEALKAGKDVYVEKPMALEIASANEAVRLARAGDRVVQVGTQHRSETQYLSAAATIRQGHLGHVSRISVSINVNHARWARDYGDCRAEDVDWEAYLFNRKKVPFDARLLRRWHLYKMCTNGLSGLWMSHYADAVNLLMGSSYPRSAVAHGGTYVWKDGREHCDTFTALIEYPENFLFSWSMNLANGSGNRFMVKGRNGTFDVDKLAFLPCGGPKDEEIVKAPIEKVEGVHHMVNWLECLRTRQRPNADIEYGRQHSVATIMAAKALHTGQRHIYQTKDSAIIPGIHPEEA
jgi:predicted dehydrogenase